MDPREREEFRSLYARLGDLAARAESGELGVSPFLSPRELHYAERYLTGMGVRHLSFGGYPEAERKKLYLLPEYMADFEGDDAAALLADFGFETEVTVLQIVGSGYRNLCHRDFLGSLLGLGLERSVIGDLAVGEEGRDAVLFCDTTIADFIETALTQVASDKVRIHRPLPGQWQIPPRRFAPIRDTVASPRIDSVVAALCGLSREKGRDAVLGGLVEMNFESEDRPDRTVPSDALISVRGYGRFRILSLEDRTKKGRFRLTAEKYL